MKLLKVNDDPGRPTSIKEEQN